MGGLLEQEEPSPCPRRAARPRTRAKRRGAPSAIPPSMKCEGTVRSFIAVETSDETRRHFEQVQARLKYAGADAKWVRPANISPHARLPRDVAHADVPSVRATVDQAAAACRPSSMQ